MVDFKFAESNKSGLQRVEFPATTPLGMAKKPSLNLLGKKVFLRQPTRVDFREYAALMKIRRAGIQRICHAARQTQMVQ